MAFTSVHLCVADDYLRSSQGGKYMAGILYYLFYFIWRHGGTILHVVSKLCVYLNGCAFIRE